ncbi:fibronectin type III domain-containing protein [Cellulomonas dongxiuzhuiae]|uniref:Fibronectin type III domain-containing protein n=1 Tax=Cellulomonas dongxiuzhuiae TaxID=2819979 RepID=A0ABX8GHB2_9CELL|nr:fibronectin type III domain-containing protein [Cellulomonas dongxiuzhuiae]MBO3088139.1 fibronectin type III domain-containing protein [Cellulomonas dongxiuzhuiae]MBO3094514.1 fibronectin type III domain-containing protein [Cellulomonas dongxiuzhuiae]QWC15537.1 fibronectin type III domain-containing protein [Cellulomonas dongxiuzhuiae]
MPIRPTGRRRRPARAVLVLVLALGVTLVPGVAHGAPVEGGASWATAVPLPVTSLDASFTATNENVPDSAESGEWANVAWYSWTPAEDVQVHIRALSIAPSGWDNTLEVWVGGTQVARNDDTSDYDAALAVELEAGRTYVIGLGSYTRGETGTASLHLATRLPSAPTDLVATAGDESATLTWSPPPGGGGVTQYLVLCTAPGIGESVCASTEEPHPATSTTIGNLENGASHAFRVVAVNAFGPSDTSAPVTVVPVAPTTTTVTADPAELVVGETFDVRVDVTTARGPAAGTVDVTVGDTSYPALTLVDGTALLEGVVAPGGTTTVTARYAGTAAVGASTGSLDVTAARRAHTITLGALPADLTYGDEPVAVTATSSLGLPLTYTAAGACVVDGTTVRTVSAGTCSLTASHPGDGDTEPASRTVTAEVARRGDVVTLELPALRVGDQVRAVATSQHGLPVTLTATGSCTVVDGLLSVTAVGDCVVTASTAGDSDTLPATATATITATAAPTAAPTPTTGPTAGAAAATPDLAVTGMSLPGAAAAVAGWLVLGAALVLVARRRTARV